MAARRWILTLACEDRVGIVAAVSGMLSERDGFIVDSQQYADLDTGHFFMRVVFQAGGPRFPADTRALREAFADIAQRFGLGWALVEAAAKPRAIVAVSKGAHCLNDLLFRRQSGGLAVEIAAIVSNHETLRGLADWHGVPFHYLPVGDGDRRVQEAAIERLIEDEGAELLILARYMQVLSADFAGRLDGRCVNIHHSFLPGFKGAKPYHRAYERGVKLIGATAHFVTGDLDEGPIIEQAVERVDHRASVDDLIAIGRDIEAQVLARAVNAIGERRVFLNGGKTLVFR
jgi:formyltetrahydrofolate deformylase